MTQEQILEKANEALRQEIDYLHNLLFDSKYEISLKAKEIEKLKEEVENLKHTFKELNGAYDSLLETLETEGI